MSDLDALDSTEVGELVCDLARDVFFEWYDRVSRVETAEEREEEHETWLEWLRCLDDREIGERLASELARRGFVVRREADHG